MFHVTKTSQSLNGDLNEQRALAYYGVLQKLFGRTIKEGQGNYREMEVKAKG
jgi:hypothetical protein